MGEAETKIENTPAFLTGYWVRSGVVDQYMDKNR
jgi:hypothetical protein